jgi:hypothetical protein
MRLDDEGYEPVPALSVRWRTQVRAADSVDLQLASAASLTTQQAVAPQTHRGYEAMM